MKLFIFTVSQKKYLPYICMYMFFASMNARILAFCKNPLALENHVGDSPFLPLPFIDAALGCTRTVHGRGPLDFYLKASLTR